MNSKELILHPVKCLPASKKVLFYASLMDSIFKYIPYELRDEYKDRMLSLLAEYVTDKVLKNCINYEMKRMEDFERFKETFRETQEIEEMADVA